jgi:predicted DNA-binding ribbon-helix-helix protein
MEHPFEETGNGAHDEDTEPVFRVVEEGGARRGIRLERIFWRALREIAQVRQKKIGALVQSILEEAPQPINTTSLLRVYCLRWALNTLATANEMTGPSSVGNLVRASPGAAFALGLDKRIVAYNQSFLNFVQARFSYEESEPVNRDLRLALDGHLADLAATLKSNGNAPVEVGFVVGIGGRRLRGKLNALLAPASGQSILLCYVLP